MGIKTMAWGLMAAAVAFAGCLDEGNARVAVSRGELAERLRTGVVRVEVELRADGTVREVEIQREVGHEDELSGRVIEVDSARSTLTVQHLGTVDFSAARRFRTEQGEITRERWLERIGATLAAGGVVALDARGSFTAVGFDARELRLEDRVETEVEADLVEGDFDQARGILRVGPLALSLDGARISEDDDDDGVPGGDDDTSGDAGDDDDHDDDDRDDDDHDDDDDDDDDDDHDDDDDRDDDDGPGDDD